MKDNYGRRIDYLRISLTDRCNLRCIYCMPEEGVPFKSHEDMLRIEEIADFARRAAQSGIRKVRLTGGEPLVRKGVVDLIREINEIPEIEDISLTTNGILLPKMAADLRDAVKKLDEGMKGTMADYQIASVAETAIMDVYPYSAEPDDKPEV